MSSPRYGWWGYAKHMIRRYPHLTNEDETAAVSAAIAETERMRSAADRLKVITMVLMDGAHTLAGAALRIPCSEHTAQRYHRDFICCVGKHFRCDGLQSGRAAAQKFSPGRAHFGALCR